MTIQMFTAVIPLKEKAATLEGAVGEEQDTMLTAVIPPKEKATSEEAVGKEQDMIVVSTLASGTPGHVTPPIPVTVQPLSPITVDIVSSETCSTDKSVPAPSTVPSQVNKKTKKGSNGPYRPSKTSKTARGLCALDWASTHPKGTREDFDVYWEAIKNEETGKLALRQQTTHFRSAFHDVGQILVSYSHMNRNVFWKKFESN
ncbi:hypothetical protein F5880DRAFT_1510197 [Lentinula raphanica]|nr:hypothetical protein F5880DRAFT_1510197 [Lentinula raphanica]